MNLDELEQSLAVYCDALARGDAVYTDCLTDFLDEKADAITETDEDRPAALAEVKERFPDVAALDDLYRNDRERFDAACIRIGEEGAREHGIIEEILDETYNGGTIMKKDQLQPRELAFIDAYLVGPTKGNAYQSARQAGYTDATARGASRDLLKRPRIMLEIDERIRQMRKQFVAGIATEAERIKQILLKIANDERAPATARVAAANSLLDRAGLTRTQGLDVSVEPLRDWDETAALLDEAIEIDGQG